MSEPLVTVVVCPREGHFMAVRSLLSLLADDGIEFELIYVDIASPPGVREALAARAAAHGFRLIRHDDWIAPAAARKAALAEVETRYVAFFDNDLLVERGCLQKLVACAEETGAGLVCPLYLQAGGGRPATIHMAGGEFFWSDPPRPRLIAEGHRLAGEAPERAAGMGRERIDYTEYHCVLGRMDLLTRPDALSDDVLLVHEHLDLALFAREQGMTVVLEPAARVTYVAFDPRALMDIDFYRRRWDIAACEESLAAFARRWPFVDREGVIGPMAGYAAGRLLEVELRRPGPHGADLASPMSAGELAQSRYALREQAIGRAYSHDDLLRIEQACDLATLLFDGVYRPDGRPFLSHGIGTASVLVRYEAQIPIVLSGLLHAAYTHRPAWINETEVSATLRERFGGDGFIATQPAARAFLAQHQADCGVLNMVGASTIAMLAANEIDMRLSGEYRATGRPADLTAPMLDRIGEVMAHFGLDGLARSARLSCGEIQAWPVLGVGVQQASFRLDAANRRIQPVN